MGTSMSLSAQQQARLDKQRARLRKMKKNRRQSVVRDKESQKWNALNLQPNSNISNYTQQKLENEQNIKRESITKTDLIHIKSIDGKNLSGLQRYSQTTRNQKQFDYIETVKVTKEKQNTIKQQINNNQMYQSSHQTDTLVNHLMENKQTSRDPKTKETQKSTIEDRFIAKNRGQEAHEGLQKDNPADKPQQVLKPMGNADVECKQSEFEQSKGKICTPEAQGEGRNIHLQQRNQSEGEGIQNQSHPNGSNSHPNGSNSHPNGSRIHPNGSNSHPNGSRIHEYFRSISRGKTNLQSQYFPDSTPVSPNSMSANLLNHEPSAISQTMRQEMIKQKISRIRSLNKMQDPRTQSLLPLQSNLGLRSSSQISSSNFSLEKKQMQQSKNLQNALNLTKSKQANETKHRQLISKIHAIRSQNKDNNKRIEEGQSRSVNQYGFSNLKPVSIPNKIDSAKQQHKDARGIPGIQ